MLEAHWINGCYTGFFFGNNYQGKSRKTNVNIDNQMSYPKILINRAVDKLENNS